MIYQVTDRGKLIAQFETTNMIVVKASATLRWAIGISFTGVNKWISKKGYRWMTTNHGILPMTDLKDGRVPREEIARRIS